ncbi:MAG TPA: hypothetical protein ENI87_11105 [bacterium]|nr:hypothetical protein [bacterium]
MRTRVSALLMCAWLPCCSLGDEYSTHALGADELIEELDEIVRIDGQGDDRRIVYRDEALLSEWYMRSWTLLPIRWGLAALFGRRARHALERPAAHVRAIVRELPYEAGDDLVAGAATTIRCGWLAELDANPHTRILALDGVARIVRQLGLTPFAGDFADLDAPLPAEERGRWRSALQNGRPRARGTVAPPAEYLEALASLTARSLPRWDARLLLVEDLTGLYLEEQDPAARRQVARALRAAIGHCARNLLLGAIRRRGPRAAFARSRRFAEVRLCALEQIRRLGGPRTVPLMLATMAASPEERSANFTGFDPDPYVLLRLIHYCGQLRGELAESVVRLPGREDWIATSPVEFLARMVFEEDAYYSKLRTPALIALTWSLGRERVDPDAKWVRQWLDGRDG